MGFYPILNAVHRLLARRRWQLHFCRRQGDDALRYYITDQHERVVTDQRDRLPWSHRRVGLTLPELLVWLDQQGDCELSNHVHALREKIAAVA